MARKSKNKKQQTFNVYPYLGGYQHFMRNGGMLPKFEDEGQVNVSASELYKKIKPTNTDQDYPDTLKGAVKEFNEHFGNRDDRSKYNTLGGLGRLGLLGNVVQGVNQGVKNLRTAFDKDSYTPGGKYSKFDETGALRFADVKLTNTTDQNALLHGENFSKYLGMSKKEREKWIESGGRNTDLWWSTDDLQYGKYNYMDRNEDGTPKFDGINYRQIKARNEMYKNPDTGESLFAIKNKNKDGTFTYFNPDGSIDYDKSSQTQYDLIEEGTGPGGLADVNAQTMIFDFDKEGENKLAAFSGFNEQTTTTGVCSDGASLTEESCTNAGGTWTTDTKTENVNPVTEYDPDVNFGNYTTTTTSEETRQQRLNREAQEGSGEDNTLRYGAELRNMLTRYDAGGVADDNLNDSTAYWDRFDNPGDPVFQDGGSLPKAQNGWSFSDWGHGVLDVAGLIPGFGEIADGVNAAWYMAEGDKTNAALSAAAMVPFAGWAATAGKLGLKGKKAVKATEATKDVVKNIPPKWSKGVTNHLPPGYHTNPAVRDSYIQSGAMAAKNNELITDMTTLGNKLDDMGYDANSLIAENIHFTNPAKHSNRSVVEVVLPNGQTQLFFRSSGNAGKSFRKTGTSEGVWSPFPGHHATMSAQGTPIDNWFVKGTQDQYDNFYGSKSFENISKRLSEIEKSAAWDMSQQGFKSLRSDANPMGLPINASKEQLEIFIKNNPGLAFPQLKKYGGTLPKAQDGVDITPGTPEDYNDSLIESIESKQNPDPNQPPEELLIPGVDFDPMENVNNFEVPNAPKPPDRTDQNVMEGQATEEQQNMGIDVSYGKGPIQKTYNKVREATNTGVLGAALDIYGGASAFAVDKLAPFLSSFAEGQDRHEAKLKQRSMSAEDFAPMMEETAGTGAKGFYDVNKGGYGDDLYGTGEIYGQVQEGKELINQNPDLSGVLSYMPSDKDQLAFNKEHLEKQKEFLGKMKNGGQLPKYQALGQVSNAKKFLNYINPFKFKPADNVFFSLGQTSQEPFTKINFNAGEDIAGFLNVNYRNKLGPSVEMVSVPEEYRNMGIATALYDKAIQEAALGVNNKASAKYPGLISGETLDNPEATINIWKHFDLDVQNTERTKMDKLLGKNKWVEDDGTTDFSSFIKDGKYEGPLVRLKGLNKKGETKVSEFRKFYDELSAEDKIMYNMTAKNVGGTTWNDIHSPLGRYLLNGFRTKNKIGDGKHFKDYNKLPLYLTLGGLAYRTFSGDGLDNEVQEKERQRYLNKRAKEEGFKNADDFIKHLSDTTREMNMESETYDYYKDSVGDLYRRGGQYEMPEYLRGGGTASEGAVLCDAYDKPIDPEKAWAADVNNNYKGPGGNNDSNKVDRGLFPFYLGGQLPKMDDGGNWNLKGWLKGEQGIIPDYKGESTKKTISENESVNKALDYTQTGLTVAGMQDYSGPIAAGADLLNSAISGGRAYAAPEGSEQRKVHTENAILNASSAIPGYGLATATTSLAKDTAGYTGVMDTNTSVSTQVADSMKTPESNPITMKGNMDNKAAKFGGEQEAEIDMDLYYELIKAGADIKILG